MAKSVNTASAPLSRRGSSGGTRAILLRAIGLATRARSHGQCFSFRGAFPLMPARLSIMAVIMPLSVVT